MKKIALAASLALTMFGSAQASAVERMSERGQARLTPTLSANLPTNLPAGLPTTLPTTLPMLAVAAALPAAASTGGIIVLQSATSELAEPEMFAMMLVGLVLIGYRATRDSSEKFR